LIYGDFKYQNPKFGSVCCLTITNVGSFVWVRHPSQQGGTWESLGIPTSGLAVPRCCPGRTSSSDQAAILAPPLGDDSQESTKSNWSRLFRWSSWAGTPTSWPTNSLSSLCLHVAEPRTGCNRNPRQAVFPRPFGALRLVGRCRDPGLRCLAQCRTRYGRRLGCSFGCGSLYLLGLDNHFTSLIDGITPSQSTFWKGLVAGSVNLLIGLLLHSYDASAAVTLGALVIGIFSYGASITLYITAAQGMGATRAQMFFASAPFFGVALSALVLGETISTIQLVAAGLLAVSLTALFRDRHHHKHEHDEMEHEHVHRHDDDHHDHTHPNLAPGTRHSHWHEHNAVEHAHPHWPDLHHRHRHE